ncbi:MAG: DUF2695 domain-containing protein [Bacteroidetes bacterium]|jgi:hypothetical protein|nr:DUF2695 domain-containing protein [Bacteroidota bacterium]
MKEVLSPSHRFWPALRQRLNDVLITYVNHKPHSKCQGDLTQTIKILRSLHNIDVEESIILFQGLECFCDCEILIGAAKKWNTK